MKLKRNLCFFAIFFFFTWTLLVLYPQPFNLAKSIYRVFNHPINPDIEELTVFFEEFSGTNPCPQEIEKFVLQNIPYSYDWEVYNMPWYFPSVKEALKNKRGDCKSRFIIIASIFERFNIPYDLYLSPTHIWINYQGKKETKIESKALTIFSTGEKTVFKIPEKIYWKHSKKIFLESAINPMPVEKKILLFIGIIFSSFFLVAPVKINENKLF